MNFTGCLVCLSRCRFCSTSYDCCDTEFTTNASLFVAYNFKGNVKIHFRYIMLAPLSLIIIIAKRCNCRTFLRILCIKFIYRIKNL